MLLFDPNDPALKAKILSLQPSTGYCIFIDVVGSTKVKDETLPQWASRIYNTFTLARSFLPLQFQPLKGIGDALMFYITEDDLEKTGEVPLQLFHGLFSITAEEEEIFEKVKI